MSMSCWRNDQTYLGKVAKKVEVGLLSRGWPATCIGSHRQAHWIVNTFSFDGGFQADSYTRP